MRQNQRRVVTGIAFLCNLNGSRRRRMSQHVRNHVGKGSLLPADEQQREQQGEERMKEGVQEAAHGGAIRPQDAPSIKLQQ